MLSILVLISGVVLLTHKKPEPKPDKPTPALASIPARRKGRRIAKSDSTSSASPLTENDEAIALRETEEGDGQVVWEVGELSDDDEDDENVGRKSKDRSRPSRDGQSEAPTQSEEYHGLMHTSADESALDDDRVDRRHRHSHSSDATVVRTPMDGKVEDEFGEWHGAPK